jgi:hypothetical protein
VWAGRGVFGLIDSGSGFFGNCIGDLDSNSPIRLEIAPDSEAEDEVVGEVERSNKQNYGNKNSFQEELHSIEAVLVDVAKSKHKVPPTLPPDGMTETWMLHIIPKPP